MSCPCRNSLSPKVNPSRETGVVVTPTGLSRVTPFTYLCFHLCKPSSISFSIFSFKLKYMLLLLNKLISTHNGLPKWLSVPVLKFRGKKK